MSIVNEYKPCVYDCLRSIEFTSKLITESDIFELGSIIIKHGYEQLLQVIVTHYHFDLSENEVLFKELTHNRVVIKPYLLTDALKLSAQPTCVVFREDSWFPIQYGHVPKSFGPWDDGRFMRDVACYLVENFISEKLAIGVRASRNEDEPMFETVDEESRTFSFKPLGEAKKVTPNAFVFDQDDRNCVNVKAVGWSCVEF